MHLFNYIIKSPNTNYIIYKYTEIKSRNSRFIKSLMYEQLLEQVLPFCGPASILSVQQTRLLYYIYVSIEKTSFLDAWDVNVYIYLYVLGFSLNDLNI